VELCCYDDGNKDDDDETLDFILPPTQVILFSHYHHHFMSRCLPCSCSKCDPCILVCKQLRDHAQFSVVSTLF
jgi:hypothetical protein